jgi:hypothetical protein
MPENLNLAQCQDKTCSATKAAARFTKVKPIYSYVRKIMLIRKIHETNDNHSDTEPFNFL